MASTPPELLIFDIDSTLLKPSYYHSPDHIRQGLYDSQLLSLFLNRPNYQIAIASFNSEPSGSTSTPYGGRRLGRMILDLQHPTGDSSGDVEDEFIQAWAFLTIELMTKHGKNEHIKSILQAYRSKYRRLPPKVTLFDDDIHNVYLAGRNGVHAYWVFGGLTRRSIQNCAAIGNRVQFRTVAEFTRARDLGILYKYIRKQPQQPVYSIYLPPNRESAQRVYEEFIQRLYRAGIVIQVVSSDIE